jgi:hypothetical protein
VVRTNKLGVESWLFLLIISGIRYVITKKQRKVTRVISLYALEYFKLNNGENRMVVNGG